jgi:hypothetical protein
MNDRRISQLCRFIIKNNFPTFMNILTKSYMLSIKFPVFLVFGRRSLGKVGSNSCSWLLGTIGIAWGGSCNAKITTMEFKIIWLRCSYLLINLKTKILWLSYNLLQCVKTAESRKDISFLRTLLRAKQGQHPIT